MENSPNSEMMTLNETEIDQTAGGVGVLVIFAALALGAAIYIVEDYING